MFDPNFLTGRYAHRSHGITLEQHNDPQAVIRKMIQWVVDHPDNPIASSVVDLKSGDTIAIVVDVHYHYDWDTYQKSFSSIDYQYENKVYRYFFSEDRTLRLS
jgi:hypothetical protein